MGDFIAHLGNVSHFNAAGSYQDQSAGHYSAGGLMIRQQSKTLSPITVRLPTLGMSCGDFDIRFGGISFIKGEEFSKMLKATAAGVPSYALQLALKTVSPQIEGTMSHLRTMLQHINGTMLNDCRARQKILEGVLPTGSALHEQVCHDMAASGHQDDYTGARDRCARSASRDEATAMAQEKHPDLLIGEFNLVWRVLNKMPRYQGQDKDDLKEFILSLVGTVLSVKEGDHYKTTYLEPKLDDDRFLDAHLRGGETLTLTCGDKTKCLTVTQSLKTISKEDSLKNQVSKTVYALKAKYRTESPFTPQEMVFLSDAVNLPLYKYIQVSAASYLDVGIERGTDYIALSILLKQFEEVAAEILEAISVLEAVQLDTKATTQFKERLELARSRLHQKIQALDTREIWMIDKIVKGKEQELMATFDGEKRL
jgi:conjugative transfer pilus assembly protein TraH